MNNRLALLVRPSSPQVVLEGKNLTWTENSKVDIEWTYSGHAIFVTKAPSLQQGAALVLLEYRATPRPEYTAGDRDGQNGNPG
jgi:hypothetical protein